jgi:hypothetical protein
VHCGYTISRMGQGPGGPTRVWTTIRQNVVLGRILTTATRQALRQAQVPSNRHSGLSTVGCAGDTGHGRDFSVSAFAGILNSFGPSEFLRLRLPFPRSSAAAISVGSDPPADRHPAASPALSRSGPNGVRRIGLRLFLYPPPCSHPDLRSGRAPFDGEGGSMEGGHRGCSGQLSEYNMFNYIALAQHQLNNSY